MAKITGKGVLKPFSQTVEFTEPLPAAVLIELLKLPETYREEVIAVKDGKVLSLDELVSNGDEIFVFLSVMGG